MAIFEPLKKKVTKTVKKIVDTVKSGVEAVKQASRNVQYNKGNLLASVGDLFSGPSQAQQGGLTENRQLKDSLTGDRTPYGASGSWDDPSSGGNTGGGMTYYTPSYATKLSAQYRSGNLVSNALNQTTGGGYSSGGGMTSYKPAPLTLEKAKEYARAAGVSSRGLEGLTYEEADKLIAEKKAQQRSQMSTLASYSFNPDQISGVKNSNKNFLLSLDSPTLKDPFKSEGSKQESLNTILKSTATDYAKSFNDINEFNNALQNPQFQQEFQPFLEAGGNLDDVAREIELKQQAPQNQVMSTPDYMASLNSQNTPQVIPQAEMQAQNDMFNETALAQNRIAQVAQIPEDLERYYFGGEETMGLLDQTKLRAEETIRNIDRQLTKEKRTLREQARLNKDKIRAELEKEEAETERNRLTAKNYMTGMLAKLGALITTGEAPKAIVTVEERYQRQKQDLRTRAEFAIREIEIDLDNRVNDLETRSEELIMKIKNDLSKDETEIMKEIMKAQQAADKETYSIMNSYAKTLRSQTEKYRKEMDKLTEKNIQEYYTIAGGNINPASINDLINGRATNKQISRAGFIPTNETGQDALTEVYNAIVMQGLTLSQLYGMFPQISKTALKEVWDQVTTGKNDPNVSTENAPAEDGMTDDELLQALSN